MEKVEITAKGEILTAKLTGELDHHVAAEIRSDIDERLYTLRPKKLVLELSGVDFMDSSGLGLILGRYAKAAEIGCQLTVRNPTPRIKRLLEISGMSGTIPMELNEEATTW